MISNTTSTTTATARPTRRSVNSSVNFSARKFRVPPSKMHAAKPPSSKKPRAFANTPKKMNRAAAQVVELGLIQAAGSPDPDANLNKTLALAERAAKRGARIICTQELFRSQYFCQSEDHENFKLAEKIPGPSTDAFRKLARKHKVVIIASLFEKRAAGVYHNTAAVIDADGSLLGKYR